jgi:hypothetical protein
VIEKEAIKKSKLSIKLNGFQSAINRSRVVGKFRPYRTNRQQHEHRLVAMIHLPWSFLVP